MVEDYKEILATSKELVREMGREIILASLSTSSPDENKPWLRSSDPLLTQGNQITTTAVAVPPSGLVSLGIKIEQVDLMKRMEILFIAEPGEDTPENFEQYNLVIDGDVSYRINFLQKLKPANVTLLYFIGVER